MREAFERIMADVSMPDGLEYDWWLFSKAWQATQQVQVSEDGWPDNIVADRHEKTGKWALHYLTDEQAAKCKAALAAINGGGK